MLGVLGWVAVLVAGDASHLPLFDLRIQVAFAAFPVPAAWDWVTQSIGRRESTNALRLGSGMLLGFAVADLIGSGLTGHDLVFFGAVALLGMYLVAVMVLLRLTGAWRRVLEQHFPGIDLSSSE